MGKRLPKDRVNEFFARIAAGRDLYAPVETDGAWDFRKVDSVDSFAMPENTLTAPKANMFPQCERLMAYRRKAGKWEPVPDEPVLERERVLAGVRPCDARSFAILDRLFINDDYVDPYYKDKRDKTFVLSLACNEPRETCFCSTLSDGPFDTEGSDVLLVDVGDDYFVEPVTDRGRELVSFLEDAPDSLELSAGELEDDALEAMEKRFETDGISGRMKNVFDDEDFWREISFACIGCGTCTYVCPTCHCFDIQDESVRATGERVRNWDSCMFPLFTLHGSGHQPRAGAFQRWRQRAMHKFRYYVENFGVEACVGCGRCIRSCPVGIDIREIISRASKAGEKTS